RIVALYFPGSIRSDSLGSPRLEHLVPSSLVMLIPSTGSVMALPDRSWGGQSYISSILLQEWCGKENLSGQLDHRRSLVLTGLLEEPVRLPFREVTRVHEQPFGPFDQLPLFELHFELVTLPAGLHPILEPGAGDSDRGGEVVWIDRLDEVVEDRGAGRFVDGAGVAVGREDDDRDRPLGSDLVSGLGAGHHRHPDVEERQVRLELACKLHCLLSIRCRGYHLVSERIELAGECQVVQRLVICDQHAKRFGHGTAPSGLVVTSTER